MNAMRFLNQAILFGSALGWGGQPLQAGMKIKMQQDVIACLYTLDLIHDEPPQLAAFDELS